jgi:hypothetical protein
MSAFCSALSKGLMTDPDAGFSVVCFFVGERDMVVQEEGARERQGLFLNPRVTWGMTNV